MHFLRINEKKTKQRDYDRRRLLGSEDELMFCGEAVKEVYLPPDTVEIGKYAFYGCVNLTTLGFSDSLLRTGAGIFTGCKLQKIYYDVYEDKKCFKRRCKRYSFSIAGKYPL